MRAIIAFIPLALLSSCVGGEMTQFYDGHSDYWGFRCDDDENDSAERARTESDRVVEVILAMNAAFRAHDIDVLNRHMADDITTYDAKSGQSLTGKEAVLKRIQEHWAADPHGGAKDFKVQRPSVTISGDIATAHYLLRAGKEEGGPTAAVNQTFRKVRDQWLTINYSETWTK